MKTLAAAALALALLSPVVSEAQDCTHFVDYDNGNNTNDGLTEGAPWKTVSYAMGSESPVGAGDTVCVKERANDALYNQVVEIERFGAAGDYLTLKAYPGHRPILKGWTCFYGEREGVSNPSALSYLVIEGFECRGSSNTVHFTNPDRFAYDHIIIRDNVLKSTGLLNVFIEVPPKVGGNNDLESTFIIIEDNVIDGGSGECLYIGSAEKLNSNGSEGGRATDYDENPFTDVRILGNTITDCPEETLDIKQNVSASEIAYNILTDAGRSSSRPIRLDGQDIDFHDNIMMGLGHTAKHGWQSATMTFAGDENQVGGSPVVYAYSGHHIHHNYFIDNLASDAEIMAPDYSSFPGATGFLIEHNTFVNSNAKAVDIAWEADKPVSITHTVRDSAFVGGSEAYLGDHSHLVAEGCNAYDIATPVDVAVCSFVTADMGLDGSGIPDAGSVVRVAASDGTHIGAWQEGGIGPPVCGDGEVEGSEECDDGNTTGGDGCSATCAIEPPDPVCGNGILEAGEDCDDGNTTGGDCCPAGCVRVSACFEAGRAQIQIKDHAQAGRDKLKWKWLKGDAFAEGDLGAPDATTTYELCVFDRTDDVAFSIFASSVVVAPSALWRSKGSKGWDYKDKEGTAAGVEKMQLRTGAAGKTKVKLQAGGTNLALPAPFNGNSYLDKDRSVTVELLSSDGSCWTSTFSRALKNTVDQFKAKAP